MKEFESHFKDVKRKRNLVIHEGKYDDEELNKLDNSIISKEFLNNDKVLLDWFASRKKQEIDKILLMLSANNDSICEFLLELFKDLTPIFLDSYNFLKTKEEDN